MSRCFPFPPPGYVRKTKVDDPDLLKKEKQKEKKHKKEKKDKEKKEGKEKREKERSGDKQREKKDKKEKHRDKKKDKEKDRDKDKHKSDLLLSDEKAVDSADNHVHRLSEKSKEREIDRNATSVEKRIGRVSGIHNGMPVSKSNSQVYETKSFKHISDVGRKTLDEERRMPNQLSDKNVGAERKKDGGVVMLAAKGGGLLQESKERTKEKSAFDERLDGRGAIGDVRSTGSGLVPNSVGAFQNRVGGNRRVEKKIEQKVDGKEKVREKEGEDRKGNRRKEKDREKPILKDKNREKEEEEIMKATIPEEKHIQMTRMKDGGEYMLKSTVKDANKKDISGVQSAGFHNITKDSNHHAANVNNLRKRKDHGLNGIHDELVLGPNKLARTSVSPHSLTENGRSLEPCQNSSAFAPGTRRPPMNIKVEPKLPHVDSTQKPPMRIKVDGTECKINGTVPKPCAQSSRETVSKAERKSSDALAKPPSHPDTKYLSQVLSVPKMDEWSNFDDQEWLFDCDSSSTRKPEVKSSWIGETPQPQVWARGVWLEPVDVYALPYVIPH